MLNNPTPKSEEDDLQDFCYPISETIRLHHLSISDFSSINLWDVLDKRKSIRSFNQISLDEINKILWASVKVKDLYVQDNGYILTHRPTPSAGARHPIDILIQSPVFGDINSIYYYNPFEHSLNKLELNKILTTELRSHANLMFNSDSNSSNGTVFWFLAHINRSAVKYNAPISLVWRDVGALIYCIQVSCTALNLNSCPIGSLGEPFVSEMFLNTGHIISAGGIIIG